MGSVFQSGITFWRAVLQIAAKPPGSWRPEMKTRSLIVFVLISLAAAWTLRYLLPAHRGLAFRTGPVVRGVPFNLIAFWTVVVVAGLAILVSMIARFVCK